MYVCKCDQIYFKGVQCEHDIRPCSSPSQCLNNGTCTNTYLNDSNLISFECKCKENFYGKFCEHRNMSGLDSKLCSHNGYITLNGNNKKKCRCYIDYSGERCEISNTKIGLIRYAQVSSLTLFLVTLGVFIFLIVSNDLFNLILLKPKKRKPKIEISTKYQFKYHA